MIVNGNNVSPRPTSLIRTIGADDPPIKNISKTYIHIVVVYLEKSFTIIVTNVANDTDVK
jgi:hypothetical protein